MNDRITKILLAIGVVLVAGRGLGASETQALLSIETGYTISKVRVARLKNSSYVVASSYEGTLLGIGYDGSILWKNTLSGFMNHDLWCDDLTGDGNEEILAANADGTVYCLNSGGKELWTFKPSIAPMNAVCTLRREGEPYVVCGGYDTNIYYLSPNGELIKTIPSSTYSQERPWGPYPKATPPDKRHTANFIRPVHRADGTEVLAVHGVIHSMASSARGSVYLFAPLEDAPYKVIKLDKGRPLAELRVGDVDHDGTEELLFGGNGMRDAAVLMVVDIETGQQRQFPITAVGSKVEGFGYRVVQAELIKLEGRGRYFVLFGSRILMVPPSLSADDTEVYACRYAFNDMAADTGNQRIVLASAQSGGSCIHILNTAHPDWKQAYARCQPPGKIDAILRNTAALRANLKRFTKLAGERDPLPVYLMTDRVTSSTAELVNDIKTNYTSPVFLNSAFMRQVENWDRSGMDNERYRLRRDRRKDYVLSRDQVIQQIVPQYKGAPGLAYWGGHGNDPYMYHLDTTKAVLNAAQGKKTVLIFPELEDHSHYFAQVMDDYIYPLAEHCRQTNGQLYIRTKHCFWQSNIYLPMWSRLLSGELADVFIPSMEETTDKSMELSLGARLGVWSSGATNDWGSRCARDNPSFDRLRQFSHQMLPNHFLRVMVFHVSHGARYLNNFPVDQDYMSLLWELIAKGALYVPKRSEIVSFSPVHLSMLEPDEHFMEASSNVKWTTFFDAAFEANNPFVFSRLSGTWPGAPVTEWDFSRYAAGVKERRLNFLAPYENGLVLITPPQQGRFADQDAPRGALIDHLHPLYKDIMQEYITDGRNYVSADGTQTFAADKCYKTVEAAINTSAKCLPLTVSGDVAWVCAQSAPKRLRLTLIDSGYINPQARTAIVHFHTAKPVGMVDILNGESFNTSKPVPIEIPCGMFRFIDIELAEPLRAVK